MLAWLCEEVLSLKYLSSQKMFEAKIIREKTAWQIHMPSVPGEVIPAERGEVCKSFGSSKKFSLKCLLKDSKTHSSNNCKDLGETSKSSFAQSPEVFRRASPRPLEVWANRMLSRVWMEIPTGVCVCIPVYFENYPHFQCDCHCLKTGCKGLEELRHLLPCDRVIAGM